jgi:hypothetical protein
VLVGAYSPSALAEEARSLPRSAVPVVEMVKRLGSVFQYGVIEGGAVMSRIKIPFQKD